MQSSIKVIIIEMNEKQRTEKAIRLCKQNNIYYNVLKYQFPHVGKKFPTIHIGNDVYCLEEFEKMLEEKKI